MSVTIEAPQSVIKGITATSRLVFAKIVIERQKQKIKDLQTFVSAIEENYKDLKKRFDALNGDRDTLQGIGIERREDGAWIFNFKTLLSQMSDDDCNELAESLKWRGVS